MVNSVRTRHVLVTTVAAGLLATSAASCSTEAGRAVGGDHNSPPASSVSSKVPGDSVGALRDVVACDLITTEERDQIATNFKVINRGPIGGSADSCTQQSEYGPDGGVTISISIRPEQVIEDYVAASTDKITDSEVAGRPAKQITNSGGTCIVTFAAERGRVDVSVATRSVKDSCDIADHLTEIVESRVPEPTT